MTVEQAFLVGVTLGGSIVLILEHVAFPFALWFATRLSRAHVHR